MHSQDLENRLKAQVDFPSPSRVATEIIALARDPDIEIATVAGPGGARLLQQAAPACGARGLDQLRDQPPRQGSFVLLGDAAQVLESSRPDLQGRRGEPWPQMFSDSSDEGKFARCVALGSDLAEAVFTNDRHTVVPAMAKRAHSLLGMSHEQFNEVVARILSLIPETEALYETSILEPDDAENLLAEARELLAVRNLHALQEVSALQATTSVLLTRTVEARIRVGATHSPAC